MGAYTWSNTSVKKGGLICGGHTRGEGGRELIDGEIWYITYEDI